MPVFLPFLFGNLKNFLYIRIMKSLIHNGFEKYLIDRNGNIFNTITKNRWGIFQKDNPRLVKSYPNKKTGYHLIVLQNKSTNGKPKAFYVHRLVAESYLPNPLNLPEVNHKDFNKSNNSVENLEWVTTEQNRYHSKLYKQYTGGKIYNSIINNQKLLNEGIELYKKFGQLKYPAEYWNVSTTTARKILVYNNIQIYQYDAKYVPIYIRTEIINHIKQNKDFKPRHIKDWIKQKFNLDLKRGVINSLRNDAFSF